MKPRKSKLDAHAAQLGEWQSQNLTLAEMQSRLAAAGCTVSCGRLSGFLGQLRQQELQARVLGNIASGSRMNAEIEAAFKRNPEPEIKTLVSFIKRLLLTLQVEGSVNPELLESANALFKSLMDYLKVEQKAQELALDRQRFQRETVELFIRWSADEEARKLAASNVSNSDKTERLGQKLFGDLWKE